jgi:hypothetical protein
MHIEMQHVKREMHGNAHIRQQHQLFVIASGFFTRGFNNGRFWQDEEE